MMPAVPLPRGARIAPTIEVKLGRGWRYDPERGVFTNERGEQFAPPRQALPRGAKIVPKVRSLARTAPARLSKAERELTRFVQIVLPLRTDPAPLMATIRRWPSVEDAQPAPTVSLPSVPVRPTRG
jgi:hypothetical protein